MSMQIYCNQVVIFERQMMQKEYLLLRILFENNPSNDKQSSNIAIKPFHRERMSYFT